MGFSSWRLGGWSQIVLFTVIVQSFFELLPAAELLVLDDSLQFLLGEADEDVFWFEVGVYHSADPVEEIQSHEYLPCDFLDDVDGEAFAVVFLQDLPQVYAQDLKHHAEVIPVGTLIEESVEKVQDVAVVSVVFFFVLLVLP